MIQDEFSTVVDSAASKATGFCFEDCWGEYQWGFGRASEGTIKRRYFDFVDIALMRLKHHPYIIYHISLV